MIVNNVSDRSFQALLLVAIAALAWLCCGDHLFAEDEKDEKKVEPKQARLMMINTDGTGLDNLGDGAMSTWSSDGKQLTFSGHRPRGVWMMNSDGTNRELLDPSGRGPQWSPDGTMIIYTESTPAGENLKI